MYNLATMPLQLTRRNFLKLGAIGTASSLVSTQFPAKTSLFNSSLGRIATTQVSVHKFPSEESVILYQRFRDEVINLYYEVQSDQPPLYNPKWYRVWGGYIHAKHVVKVHNLVNPTLRSVPEEGVLAAVTVPYTQSWWDRKTLGWEKAYRLYYDSVHWIINVIEGPDGEPWYQVLDQLLRNVTFYAKAEHFRIITPQETAPISPEVPFAQKRIEVSIDTQTLTAFEYDQIVFQTKISSGMYDTGGNDGQLSTNTPLGEFHIFSKMPSKHMGDGNVTSDIEAYELPGVPWTTFFVPDPYGVAFHGTYWHDNFGVRMSHGCINMRTEEARWIFRWTLPENLGDKIEKTGYGTRVIIY